jgi:hypothetical protein
LICNRVDVGLSDVNDTSDINKPISTAQQTALNLKEDEISNKQNSFSSRRNKLNTLQLTQLSKKFNFM